MTDAPSPGQETEKLPAHARVVIIGGGVMGCGAAYHLAHAGWSDVVLLEKGELTSGSSWHAAGQATYATSSYSLAKCAAYSVGLYQRLEKETGQSTTWHGCGSLRIAYTVEEEDWLRQIVSVGKALELPVEIVDVARVKELHPFYNLEGAVSALHTVGDGHVDPAGATFALAKGAAALGVTVVRRCRATGVSRSASGEWAVETEQGTVACEHLVNAGGMYARQIALWSGYDLPTTSMSHHYFVTEPVPEFKDLERELPVVRDDSQVSGYLRQEQQSGLIGIYEKSNTNSVWHDGAPWEAEHELFEPDYDRVMPWLEDAMKRFPVLAPLGIRRAVHGAISHPPDGNPLVGPAPGLRNYWCCAGCQIGFGWGPALGRELARWIVAGGADINMREFDPRRFGDYAGPQYQIAKAHEDYQLRHEIPYPHFSRTMGRPARTSAVHGRLAAKGAVFEEICGWERPRWFGTARVPPKDVYSFRRSVLHEVVGAEAAAVRERAGVTDVSAFAKIEVRGSQAAELVDSLIANRVPDPGRIALAHFLSAGGRIEAESTVMRLDEDRLYLCCAAFLERRLFDILSFAAGGRAEVVNRSKEWGALALNGPRSRDVLAGCADEDVGNEAFPWLRAKQLTIAGGKVWAFRMSYAGELGWELHGENAAVADAYDALTAAGERHGIADYGTFAMDSLRMEKAYHGASELTNELTLPEADVMRFVKADKQAFVGREATLKALQEPLRWKCVYMEVDDDGDCDGNGGEGVYDGSRRVGVVSSVAYGHHVGKVLAFAFVAPDCAEAGRDLQMYILGKPRGARVLAEPAYDPANGRPRQ